MKTASKGWDQCGNAQAVVNEQQIIVAADMTDPANDVRQVEPMLEQTIGNIDQAGVSENIGAGRSWGEPFLVSVGPSRSRPSSIRRSATNGSPPTNRSWFA